MQPVIVLIALTKFSWAAAPVDWIERSPSGAYQFGFATGDEGGHYRTETASADNTVAGKYGFRDPASGANLETTYTSGRRGFRARGPHIARRMGLSQAGGPSRPEDDGQYHPELDNVFDPTEDLGYDFKFRTRDTVKEEHADPRGDVRGRYTYLDDVGGRHTVDYTAGANKGFNVLNPVPDTFPQAQNSPLVFHGKGPGSRARGFTAIQKSLDGSYRFSASGPDHKRTEVSDAQGNRRGSYSYLDDKGEKHTVEYIAGPNIGYQVINNRRPLVFGPNGTPIPSLSPLSPDPSLSPLFPDSPTPSPYPPLPSSSPFYPDLPVSSSKPLIPTQWTPTTSWPSSTPSWIDHSGYDDFNSLHSQLFSEGLHTQESTYPRRNQTGSCCGSSWHSGPKRNSHYRGRAKFDSVFDGSTPQPIALRAHVQNIDVMPIEKRFMSPGEALELFNREEAEHRSRQGRSHSEDKEIEVTSNSEREEVVKESIEKSHR